MKYNRKIEISLSKYEIKYEHDTDAWGSSSSPYFSEATINVRPIGDNSK